MGGKVIMSIEAKTNTFYVINPYNGKRSNVGVVRATGWAPYLRAVTGTTIVVARPVPAAPRIRWPRPARLRPMATFKNASGRGAPLGVAFATLVPLDRRIVITEVARQPATSW